MMNKEALSYAVDKTHQLMAAASCSGETKAVAQAWLAAIRTEGETAETKKYMDELEADIMTVDDLIAFTSSEAGIQHFGADKAKSYQAHAAQIKAAGAKYCDCPACAAAADILTQKEELLK